MSKPDDIPQDIWDSSRLRVGTSDSLDLHTEWIARAVMAERSSCAQIAFDAMEEYMRQKGDSEKSGWSTRSSSLGYENMAIAANRIYAKILSNG